MAVNVADVWPPGITTLEGTVAKPLELPRLTSNPLAPQGPVKFTVPVELLPPTTELGFKVTEAIVAGLTVRTQV